MRSSNTLSSTNVATANFPTPTSSSSGSITASAKHVAMTTTEEKRSNTSFSISMDHPNSYNGTTNADSLDMMRSCPWVVGATTEGSTHYTTTAATTSTARKSSPNHPNSSSSNSNGRLVVDERSNNNNNNSSNTSTNKSTLSSISSAVRKSLSLHNGGIGTSTKKILQQQQQQQAQQQPQNCYVSLYQDLLFQNPNTTAVESVLAAACEGLNFEIAEMWLRTGPKTHQLIHSHIRPTALEEDVAAELVDVYYGEKSCERTHRLSPALCKRAKEAGDVVWVTAHNERDADTLRYSISDVRTAVAVPVCHSLSNTNITLIYFSIKRAMMQPPAVEFLVHLSLAATNVLVNTFAEEIFLQDISVQERRQLLYSNLTPSPPPPPSSKTTTSPNNHNHLLQYNNNNNQPVSAIPYATSIGGAKLDMKWTQLANLEYLTDGGNNWIHTAVVDGKAVVVKTLKPECQDLALAINELESELDIHARLSHMHIVNLIGAGVTSKGYRFIVLERLDGGTLSQVLGYDTRIRDRRRRFWKKKSFSFLEVLTHARSLAAALAYLHGRAVPGCMVIHRDLKPDNIGFTLDGTLKVLDFGLARLVENSSPYSDQVYHMSGETGSLRYMAPEVADSRPYNHKADVYSFGKLVSIFKAMRFLKARNNPMRTSEQIFPPSSC